MVSPSVLAVLRTSPEEDQHILTMTNVTKRPAQIEISLSDLNIEETRWYDLLGEKDWIAEKNKISVTLEPYDVLWLKPYSEF
jgi:sucrose phosphorylase